MRGKMVKKNVGGVDRVVRIIAGTVLVAVVFVGPHTPWGWLGLVPLATGLIGWCPLYGVLGFGTCPVRK
jgi:hypothetical protein